MTATRAPGDDGPPVSIVIYPTPDGWRHSTTTKHGRQFSQLLLDIPADAAADTAKDAATGLVATFDACFFHLGLDVAWERGEQPGWWTGSVYRINGEPI